MGGMCAIMEMKRLQHRRATSVDATRAHLGVNGDRDSGADVNATSENSKKPTRNDQMKMG